MIRKFLSLFGLCWFVIAWSMAIAVMVTALVLTGCQPDRRSPMQKLRDEQRAWETTRQMEREAFGPF